MSTKYRNKTVQIDKTVEIDAIQFNGLDDYLEIVALFKETNTGTLTAEEVFELRAPIMIIRTLEGTMAANPGDWIIRGIQGEFYPCKPEIFEATYEPVEATSPLPGRDPLTVGDVLKRIRLTWPGLDVTGHLLSLTAQPGDTISGRPVRVDVEVQPDTSAAIALSVPEHATIEVLS